MPKPLTKDAAQLTIDTINKLLLQGYKLDGRPPSAYAEAAEILKISVSGVQNRLKVIKNKYGLEPELPITAEPMEAAFIPNADEPIDSSVYLSQLKSGRRRSLVELAEATKTTVGQVLDGMDELKRKGANIHRHGDMFEIPTNTQQSFVSGPTYELESLPDNTYIFGATGDLHAASKYTRWDVREDLYNKYVAAGAQCVFDTGNWIDGECNFNRYDIEAHGLDGQCRVLANMHPKKGIRTLAVWGDDHEGWYSSRDGVDAGRYCEGIMQEAGHDWVNLGFMEAHVTLKNANTGATAVMAVVHPGGGSAYALSYSIQKIVESYEGGEKPDVGLYGHYHKLWAGIIRNVWVAQTGCAQDQTPFMRKKRLEAHVGGTLIKLEQDPDTGAITSMTPQIIRYFNKGFYNNRWSKTGPVNLPHREV